MKCCICLYANCSAVCRCVCVCVYLLAVHVPTRWTGKNMRKKQDDNNNKKNREREIREMRKKEWNVTKSGTSSSVFIKQGNSISRVISQLKRAREKGLHPKPNQKNCFSQSMFAQRLDSFYFLHCFLFLSPSFSACMPRPIGRKMGVFVYFRVDRETWRIWVIILVFTRVDVDLGDSSR